MFSCAQGDVAADGAPVAAVRRALQDEVEERVSLLTGKVADAEEELSGEQPGEAPELERRLRRLQRELTDVEAELDEHLAAALDGVSGEEDDYQEDEEEEGGHPELLDCWRCALPPWSSPTTPAC